MPGPPGPPGDPGRPGSCQHCENHQDTSAPSSSPYDAASQTAEKAQEPSGGYDGGAASNQGSQTEVDPSNQQNQKESGGYDQPGTSPTKNGEYLWVN